MFILAGLFALGKDIKLLRLTPETRDREAGERGREGGWLTKEKKLSKDIYRTIHKLYLSLLLC